MSHFIQGECPMKYKWTFSTPLGEMAALIDKDKLCGLWFSGQKHEPAIAGNGCANQDCAVFNELRRQLDAYFARRLSVFDLPLSPAGTAFQMAVWSLLKTIPAGETTTYGELARQMAELREGRPPAAQAIGGAVGRNPISIIIPCHRVIGADGSLTGYAGGIERKFALIQLEQAGISDN